MAQIYIDDKPYGLKDALKIIGVSSEFIPKRRERIFEPPKERIVKDTLNGGFKMPKRIGVQPAFHVFSKEFDREVEVRYVTSSRPVVQNGISQMTYQPIQLFIHGEAELVPDDIEFTFRYLHPACKQSPLRSGNNKKAYKYIYRNTEQEAADELFKDELKIRALSIIIGENAKPISDLRRILKGFGVTGVDHMEEATVKKQLKDKANEDPEKFLINVQAKDFQLKAMVRDAVDRNILIIKTSNGYHQYFFNGEKVHEVPGNLNAFNQLVNHVAENLNRYYKPIQDQLAGKTLDALLNLPENEQFFNDPVIADETKTAFTASIPTPVNKDIFAEEKQRKLAYWATLDLNDPNIHHSTRKAMEKNMAEIEAYKKEHLKT